MWRVMASAPIGPMPDRVSVGLGLRGEVETDGQRAARAVVDHDLLPELLAKFGAEDARDRIGGAASGLRDDEPDRSVQVSSGKDLRGQGGPNSTIGHKRFSGRVSKSANGRAQPSAQAAFTESTARPW